MSQRSKKKKKEKKRTFKSKHSTGLSMLTGPLVSIWSVEGTDPEAPQLQLLQGKDPHTYVVHRLFQCDRNIMREQLTQQINKSLNYLQVY